MWVCSPQYPWDYQDGPYRPDSGFRSSLSWSVGYIETVGPKVAPSLNNAGECWILRYFLFYCQYLISIYNATSTTSTHITMASAVFPFKISITNSESFVSHTASFSRCGRSYGHFSTRTGCRKTSFSIILRISWVKLMRLLAGCFWWQRRWGSCCHNGSCGGQGKAEIGNDESQEMGRRWVWTGTGKISSRRKIKVWNDSK